MRIQRLVVTLLILSGWITFEMGTDRIGVFVAAQTVSYIAFEQVTVANTSIGFTATKVEPNGTGGAPQATMATCRLETAEIRYQVDGTAPTTTVGTLLEVGDVLTLNGHDSIMRFRGIRTGASSGVLSCNYSQP
jgi:hypothetical protein